jgi:glutathione synthase/RimK-type ligase-like ATP-grasp enzyme
VSNILIITNSLDATIVPVHAALEHLGHHVSLLRMTEFPSRDIQSWHISAENETFEWALNERSQCDAMFDSVWCRRPTVSNSEEVNIHADDRDFVDRVYREYSLSTFYALRFGLLQRTGGAFWVNPYESIAHANSKLVQLLEARNCGLTIPATLVSNNPDRVQAFLSEHNHRIVCKAFVPHAWHSDTGATLPAVTGALSTLQDIAPASIRVAPSI